MGGQAQELTGPDFAAGVAIADLRDGEPKLGHANGEAVVVVKRGAEIFAVGASCTHYGGALSDGICEGGTIRCPLHHARFDLKTGDSMAPALAPIACYSVEKKGDVVTVGAKKARGLVKLRPGPKPRSVVIVGGGAAGHAAAEMLRREGYEGSVTMVSADEAPPVDRPNLSKDYLAGTAPEDWVPLRPIEAYAETKIDLKLGTRVEAIDVAKKTLLLAGGASLSWDALILATGATPRRLALPGGNLPHVRVLRTLADARAIIDAAKTAKRACVIGASFIGLEVAASLRTRGLEVHVVAPETTPLARIMGDQVGAMVRAIHEEHGVRFHLGRTPKAIDAKSVLLDSGESIDAELVVAGVGVVPSTDLAESAGIAVDRGILVNERLETSAPDIWAAGDAARWPDPHTGSKLRVEHWVVAQRMGQLAARNVLGAREACSIVPFFWSQHYDVPIAYVGHAEAFDRVEVFGDVSKRDFAVVLLDKNEPRAVITVGRDKTSLAAEAAMDEGDWQKVLAVARG